MQALEEGFRGLRERADEQVCQEVLREHEEQFREVWSQSDKLIRKEEMSAGILGGRGASVVDVGLLPIVPESPLGSPGRASEVGGADP